MMAQKSEIESATQAGSLPGGGTCWHCAGSGRCRCAACARYSAQTGDLAGPCLACGGSGLSRTASNRAALHGLSVASPRNI